MKILLTGATGFLGYRTLERLVTIEGIKEIKATGRNLMPNRQVNHSKVTYILGDLENKEFVLSIAKDVDIIINTASLSSPWGARSEFIASNITTQINMIDAAKAYNVKRFIYISSPSIYFNGEHRLMVKETDPLPRKFINCYAQTKREAEVLLEESKIPYIILRPRAIIGRGDSIIMPRLIRAYDEGKIKIIGDGNNVVDLTSVDNVVESIVLAFNAQENALNNVYNITDDQPINLWKEITSILHQLERSKPLTNVSYRLALLASSVLEIKSKLIDNKEPALTTYAVGTLALSFTLDITKAKALLGYKPITTTQASINEFAKWYQDNEKM